MTIKEITDKDVWENFLLTQEEKTFLDSWSWGEFQKKQGEKIWRLGIYDEGLVGVALVIKISARRGTFLFVPHGPNTISNFQFPIFNQFVDELKKIAKKEKAIFIRIAPIIERNEENQKTFRDLGFRPAPTHIHPELTWELDISRSEDEIFSGMRKTTRYLIKRAEKDNNIEVVKSTDPKDIEEFNKIYEATAQRHRFVPFSPNYLEKQFSSFGDNIVIFLGKYKGKVVSSAMMVYWQGIGFYHHGASLSEYNNNKTPVSYLMQWKAILEGKRRGCVKYNFWGIAPNDNKNHPWAGLTLFKKGFGGYRKDYVKTQDLPLSSSYYFTYSIEKIRKLKRRL